MASIQKMKNGRWRYRVSYKENGKYKTKTKGGFRTKKEAELAAAELEKQLHKGYDINAGDQLFSEYMRNWYEVYKKGKYSLAHERNIELSVRLVEEYFAGVKLKDVTRDMYQKFINEIAKNHSTATVQKRHTYIKSCLRDAIEDGIITRDPTYKVIIKGEVETKSEELKYLNFDEVKKLVAEIKRDMKPRYISRYIILFAIATGARFSEIAGLTWDCVDFKNKTVTINKTWDFKDKNDFSDTKTFDSKRTITIDDETLNMLKELRKHQNELAMKTGLRNTKNLVFVNTKMEVVTNNAVNKTLRALCKKVGIKTITCHGLRHTHASMLLYKGVNVKYVSRRLGHKDIVTTLQTYSHILDEMEQKESRQVDLAMEELYHAK
ncbi:site-specific integrase [Geobacillus sp. 46C-IIa]|uniref:tyrosine-type recombinase/integrase n=1 Tax=Geobacillus sp. 46C-IIa TaxID=1963025 RepID=UPI0009BD9160|nr:site-specific integrase [Geobacillus sp. 46C-IIa]OQP07596.1 site-specific integrase [Geobacillus sp. 46C-IIa]QNU28243.1 tyrosine-type recombinase/integrase [Geobacillus sp. 46C-IIa]